MHGGRRDGGRMSDLPWEVQSVSVCKGEDDGDYIHKMLLAPSAAQAAEDAVSAYWRDDHGPLPQGMLVKVMRLPCIDPNAWQRFIVSGEPDVHWRVSEDQS